MKDCEQQVHSSPCSQITGVRGLVSTARVISPAKLGASPSAVAVSEQNLRKLRRVMRWRRMTS